MAGILVQTDARGRVTLPGQKNKSFLLEENEDGSVVLQPAVVVSQAQYEYDNDPALRAMLAEAMTSPRVGRRAGR